MSMVVKSNKWYSYWLFGELLVGKLTTTIALTMHFSLTLALNYFSGFGIDRPTINMSVGLFLKMMFKRIQEVDERF